MASEKLINPDVVLDGTPSIVQPRRASIKLATKPQIIVAMPIGGKPVSTVLECPNCKVRHDADPESNPHYRYEVNEGFRAPGLIPIQFLLSHMNWVPPLNVSMAYMVQFGMLSAQARQIMTMEAIRVGAKYIFYVDDDTLIPPKGLYTLHNFMEQNPLIGAVSGVYTTREDPPEPLIYRAHGEGCAWDFEMGELAIPEPIFGAGAGCLLARVEAIQCWMEQNPGVPIWADERQLPEQNAPPFKDGEANHRVMWGHDIRFCKCLNEVNWPVYVDGRVLCGHYDILKNKIYSIPDTAPGFKYRKNINTRDYWDNIYSKEGAIGFREYPEMFGKVTAAVDEGETVTELGCGKGILGSRLTAEKQVKYYGYDISEVAVEMCKTRFLHAEVRDVREISIEELKGTVIMTELIEHLSQRDATELLDKVYQSEAEKFIVTCPDHCLGPDEWREHEQLFSVESLASVLKASLPDWSIEIDKGDDFHLIAVLERPAE